MKKVVYFRAFKREQTYLKLLVSFRDVGPFWEALHLMGLYSIVPFGESSSNSDALWVGSYAYP